MLGLSPFRNEMMVSFLALSQGEEDVTCEASHRRGFDLVFAKLPNAQQKVRLFKKKSYQGVLV